jgi:hypothetical protein
VSGTGAWLRPSRRHAAAAGAPPSYLLQHRPRPPPPAPHPDCCLPPPILPAPTLLLPPQGIFPMLKLFQAGGAQNTTFAILYIVNVVIW